MEKKKITIFGKSYWLAGRETFLYDNHCAFGLQKIVATTDSCRVSGQDLFTSNMGDYVGGTFGIRPIVAIDLNLSGYSLEKINEDGIEAGYTLKK